MSQYKQTDHEGLQAVQEQNPPIVVHQTNLPQLPQPQIWDDEQHTDPQHWDDRQNEAIASQKFLGETFPHKSQESGTICGVRKATFVLACLLGVTIIAAIVIGVVLGTQKSKTESASPSPSAASSQQSTSSAASSSSSPSAATATGAFVAPIGATVALDCPAIDKQTITDVFLPTSSSFKYQVSCGSDCQSNNIFPIWSYSLDMCVQACVSMNYVNATDKQCGAVAFRADMGNVSVLGGNCFLKTSCEPVSQSVNIANAILVS